jgi:hypothetical protein
MHDGPVKAAERCVLPSDYMYNYHHARCWDVLRDTPFPAGASRVCSRSTFFKPKSALIHILVHAARPTLQPWTLPQRMTSAFADVLLLLLLDPLPASHVEPQPRT